MQSQLVKHWYEVGQVQIYAKEGDGMDLIAFSGEMVDGKISPSRRNEKSWRFDLSIYAGRDVGQFLALQFLARSCLSDGRKLQFC
ncbi:hypothetical protein MRB53_026941 [Persea americana]|uniref:Uncharacterized protein n=1 Tax=Persea americana TaxID=3435 RepID=A0ACC2LK13_PERAE|nr:hypothetical protein MRB53_026941 [Persea americana]